MIIEPPKFRVREKNLQQATTARETSRNILVLSWLIFSRLKKMCDGEIGIVYNMYSIIERRKEIVI